VTVIYPAILSGGSGTRLWPLSTEARPKQFHALAGARTLMQETALRLRGEADGVRFADPIVIGNASQADLIVRQLAEVEIRPALVVLEPVGRNTAATAAVAAAAVRELDPGALAFLAPADHAIQDASGLRALIARAARIADQAIVTFGIVPDRPETGYGYIEVGPEIRDGMRRIARFKEKPDAATAADYVASGAYLWNGGMFLFRPDLLLQEFDAAPEIRDRTLAAWTAASRAGPLVSLGPDFAQVPALPIDIAVMERTARGAVAPCNVGWADIGSWFELWRMNASDAASNVSRGPVTISDCSGSLVHAKDIVVAAAGLVDMIVVATPEAVLILPKHRAQEVKALREAALALTAAG